MKQSSIIEIVLQTCKHYLLTISLKKWRPLQTNTIGEENGQYLYGTHVLQQCYRYLFDEFGYSKAKLIS